MRDSYENPFAIYATDTSMGESVVLNEYRQSPMYTIEIMDTNVIRNMTERERLSNPDFLISSLLVHGNPSEILQIVGDTQFLRDWIMVNLSSMTENILEKTQELLCFDVAIELNRIDLEMRREIPENIDMSHSILKENFDFGFPKYQFGDRIEKEEMER